MPDGSKDAIMNILVVYKSYHHMNTEKVARVIAEATNAVLKKAEEVCPKDIEGYDLVGFGSGIYAGKHHKTLFTLVDGIRKTGKEVFIFSTSGVLKEQFHRPLRERLAEKGCHIVGEFQCPGEVSPLGFNLNLRGGLGWLAGKNRGHPDAKDLEDARYFAKGLTYAEKLSPALVPL
jgi:flavodoxin